MMWVAFLNSYLQVSYEGCCCIYSLVGCSSIPVVYSHRSVLVECYGVAVLYCHSSVWVVVTAYQFCYVTAVSGIGVAACQFIYYDSTVCIWCYIVLVVSQQCLG